MKKEFLKKIFWDMNEADFDKIKDQQIISRVFSYGGLDTVKNMFSFYGKSNLRKYFSNVKENSMTKKRYNYFNKLLN